MNTKSNLTVKKQQGFSLLIALLLFAAVTIVGLAVMRSGILSERQAANIQEKSVTVHGAQSSNNSVVTSFAYEETFIDAAVNKTDLSDDLYTHTNSNQTCVNRLGVVRNCNNPGKLNNNNGGLLRVSTETFYRSCEIGLKCMGTTADLYADNNVGCNAFEHRGQGFIDLNNDQSSAGETSSSIDQWSVLVAACDRTSQNK